MSNELMAVADAADVIVNGYAFQQKAELVFVLNLNKPDSAAVMRLSGEVLETSMDDIELAIVQDYLQKNLKYMEAYHAEIL